MIVLKTNKLSTAEMKTKSEPDTTVYYRAHKLNIPQIKNWKKTL